MIKKLVSNALLSMVMDKKAREKFNAAREAKARANDGAKVGTRTDADPRAQASSKPGFEPEVPALTEPGFTAKAKAKFAAKPATKPGRPAAKAPVPSARAPQVTRGRPPGGDDEDAATLIRQALEEAELELINKRKRKSMTPERQALIEQAMAIHRSKSHVLDELDPEHRDKLTFMAMKALDPKFGE